MRPCYTAGRTNVTIQLNKVLDNRFQINCPTAALQSQPRSWRPIDGMAAGSGWVWPATPLLFRAFFTNWSREALCSCQPPCTRHRHIGWADASLVSAWPVLLPLPAPHSAWLGSSKLRSQTPAAKFIPASLYKGAASCHASGGIGNGRMLYKTQKTQSIPRGRSCTIPVGQVHKIAWKCWFWAFFALLFWEELVGGGYISTVVN